MITASQTEQCEPSVNPVCIQDGATAASISIECPNSFVYVSLYVLLHLEHV